MKLNNVKRIDLIILLLSLLTTIFYRFFIENIISTIVLLFAILVISIFRITSFSISKQFLKVVALLICIISVFFYLCNLENEIILFQSLNFSYSYLKSMIITSIFTFGIYIIGYWYGYQSTKVLDILQYVLMLQIIGVSLYTSVTVGFLY
jgi:hypothetical protein